MRTQRGAQVKHLDLTNILHNPSSTLPPPDDQGQSTDSPSGLTHFSLIKKMPIQLNILDVESSNRQALEKFPVLG